MLNTDLHNTQVKNKMTKQQFIKNNRGIDNGKDISPETLEEIYDIINSDEIVMKDERVDASSDERRDPLQRFAMASENMAQKTEAILNTLQKGKGSIKSPASPARESVPATDTAISDNFYTASHYEHIKPMFELIWLAILAGLSWPQQETNDMETVEIALEGFRHAIRISCMFDLTLEMKAFVSTLSKSTQLNNLNELRGPKNLAAVKALLEVAYTEGNHLQDCWKDVVKCVSQLEKLQIIGGDQVAEQPNPTTKR